jgi:hypothetical protein
MHIRGLSKAILLVVLARRSAVMTFSRNNSHPSTSPSPFQLLKKEKKMKPALCAKKRGCQKGE